MKNIITLDKVSKSYGELRVLEDFSLRIYDSIAVMGPSGKGKTTLTRIIMGLEGADHGAVYFEREPRISAVFQEDRLFDGFDAIENICAAVGRTLPKTEARRIAAELLCEVRIDPSEHDKPVRDYSGGMRRRVAIARALAVESDILILDEPYKGLDADTREAVAAVIREKAADRLIILVTHDRYEAELTGIDMVITVE